MKNYRASDYAANKYAHGIVYRFANETVEVTLEDFLRENPGKSATDFAELKALSDSLYLECDRADYRQNSKNIPISGFAEAATLCAPSAEAEVIDIPLQAANAKKQRERLEKVLSALTATQRRRYIQHEGEGLSSWAIAEREGVSHQSVLESLNDAKKKIKKVLENT